MSYYFIKSKLNGNVIDIQAASLSAGASLVAFPQKGSGTGNQLWEFVPDRAGSGYYFIKSESNGNVIDLAGGISAPGTRLVANPQIPPTRSADSQLWQFYEHPAGSGYCYIQNKLLGGVIDIVGASTASAIPLETNIPKVSNCDHQLWQVVGGSFPSIVTAAPAPTAGLGSNSNYFLSGDGNPLFGVCVTIRADQDIVGSNGFGFQLNGYSQKGDYDSFQQYIIFLSTPPNSPPILTAVVNNWSSSGQIVNHDVPLATLPSQILPKGYELLIGLQNDSFGNIVGVIYKAFDASGNAIGDLQFRLLALKNPAGTHQLTQTDVAPIVCFQLNLVGCNSGGATTLSSGSGSVFYTASNLLSPLSAAPPFVATSTRTAETANSRYSSLPNRANSGFIQTFEYVAPAQ